MPGSDSLGRLALAAVMSVLLAAPVFAAEVVHFSNGTHLVVRSHEVRDGMLHVVLARDAEMAFPLKLVESVEMGGQVVTVQQLVAPNQQVPSEDGGPAPSVGAPPTEGARSAPVRATRSASSGGRRAPSARVPLLGGPAARSAEPEPATPERVGGGRGVRVTGDRSLVRAPGGRKIIGSQPGSPRTGFRPTTIRPRRREAPPQLQRKESSSQDASGASGGGGSAEGGAQGGDGR